jgi:hypothetical protein
MTKFTTVFGIGALALTASAVAMQAARQLIIDGNVVSTGIKQEDGHYWVSLDDVDKYFGYSMAVDNGKVTLTKNSTAPNGSLPAPVPATASTTTTPALGATTNASSTDTTPVLSSDNPAASTVGLAPGAAQSFAGTGTVVNRTDMTMTPQVNLISVSVGQNASVNGFDYKVDDIRPVGATYKQVFDQRGNSLHAKYKSDTLVVVDIEETNQGTSPIQAFLPEVGGVTVYDGQKVGYAASGIDVRQSGDLIEQPGSDLDVAMDVPYESLQGLTLGKGGTLRFAAIASVPKGVQISGVSIDVSNMGVVPIPSGTIVSVSGSGH